MINNHCTLALRASAFFVLVAWGNLQAATQFSEVSVAAGLGNESYSAYTDHTGGVAWIDYDVDGYPDIFAINGFNKTPQLYHNNQDGTFSLADTLLPTLPNREYTGAVFGDVDNDGDPDIFITVSNEQWDLTGANNLDGPADILLENRINAAEGKFVDSAAAAGIDGVLSVPLGSYPAMRTMTGGMLDIDRDGLLDIYAGSMVLNTGGSVGNQDRLWKNNGDGSFTDVAIANGIADALQSPSNLRPTLAFIGAQLDQDMAPDMYMINVHDAQPFSDDKLFKNNGDGTYIDYTDASTAGTSEIGNDAGSGMGIDVADIDLDGDFDMYITDVYDTTNDENPPPGNVLYLSNGDGTFSENIADLAGVQSGMSWGVTFQDFDNDGDPDLWVGVTGKVSDVFQNNGNNTFTNIRGSALSGLATGTIGLASADYDRDGDRDVLEFDNGSTLKLFRNDSSDCGNWMLLDLIGVQSNKSAIGARVTLTAGGKTMLRQVVGGSSAHSQNELTLHWGLAEAVTADTLTIEWPSGAVDTYSNLEANAMYQAIEDLGIQTVAVPGGACGHLPPETLSVSAVRPGSLTIGSTKNLTVTGTGFTAGTTVATLSPADPKVQVRKTTVTDAHTLSIRVRVLTGAVVGSRTLTVRDTTTNETVGLTNAVTIVQP